MWLEGFLLVLKSHLLQVCKRILARMGCIYCFANIKRKKGVFL